MHCLCPHLDNVKKFDYSNKYKRGVPWVSVPKPGTQKLPRGGMLSYVGVLQSPKTGAYASACSHFSKVCLKEISEVFDLLGLEEGHLIWLLIPRTCLSGRKMQAW